MKKPTEIALCLSGGGSCASLFHLGLLKRLNELALLEAVKVISAVSGGAVTAAALAHSLSDDSHESNVVFWDSFEKSMIDIGRTGLLRGYMRTLILHLTATLVG